jgi:hypothetical protein
LKKSRHLAVIAVGTCLGLAGVGQVAFANRESRPADVETSCAANQDNESDNATGDVEQSGLINLGQINLQGNNLGVLSNLLCGGLFLNDLTAGVLGTVLGGGASAADGDSEISCSADQSNDSESETGDIEQGGLIGIGGIALQGNNIGLLDNTLCGSNFLNGTLASVLGTVLGGEDEDGDREVECSADSENESENSTGEVTGLASLLNLSGLALQGNNIGVGNNALCGAVFGNDITAAVLGLAGRF